MKLEIYDPENILTIDFGVWLLYRIRQHILHRIDPKQLVRWNIFFQSSSNKKIAALKADRVLTQSARNLRVRKLPDKLVIYVNNNNFMPGLDRVRVYSLLKLVTFGNLSVKGYPLFTTVLQYFADNINVFIELYERKD